MLIFLTSQNNQLKSIMLQQYKLLIKIDLKFIKINHILMAVKDRVKKNINPNVKSFSFFAIMHFNPLYLKNGKYKIIEDIYQIVVII